MRVSVAAVLVFAACIPSEPASTNLDSGTLDRDAAPSDAGSRWSPPDLLTPGIAFGVAYCGRTTKMIDGDWDLIDGSPDGTSVTVRSTDGKAELLVLPVSG